MGIFFFTGPPRTGKTVHIVMNAWGDYLNRRKIFSLRAPTLKFPPVEGCYTPKKLDVQEFLDITKEKIDRHPKTFLIQEASKIFDARRSGREENTALSSVTGQSGKRNIDILYDDQFPTRIDKGLRDVTDKTYLCSCIPLPETKQDPIVFEYFEFQGFMLYPTGNVHRIPAMFMKQFYPLYDTFEPTERLITEKKKKNERE